MKKKILNINDHTVKISFPEADLIGPRIVTNIVKDVDGWMYQTSWCVSRVVAGKQDWIPRAFSGTARSYKDCEQAVSDRLKKLGVA